MKAPYSRESSTIDATQLYPVGPVLRGDPRTDPEAVVPSDDGPVSYSKSSTNDGRHQRFGVLLNRQLLLQSVLLDLWYFRSSCPAPL